MPLYDYKCPQCGKVREVLIHANSPVKLLCDHGEHHVPMERQPSAPNFTVKGFNSKTGYTGQRTFTSSHDGITTRVTGNPEAFETLHD